MEKKRKSKSVVIDGEYTIDETSSEERNLSASKDKGQLASTTALSITNVALLAKIYVAGHDETRYHDPALAMTGVSLGCLLLAALLSMHNAQTRDYYHRYNDDLSAECCFNFCHCRCRKREGFTCCSCLPCGCSCRVTDDFERTALKDYDKSKKTAAEAELQMILLENDKSVQPETAGNCQYTDTCDDHKCQCSACRLNITNRRKREMAEHELHAKYTMAIRENWVMKRVTFWQNVINYLLYIVAILNTFVAALGLLPVSIEQ